MKKTIIASIVLASTLIAASATAKDFTGAGYQVDVIRPGGDRPCTLFTLVGVPTVDANSGTTSPWFVIEHNTPEYNQVIATLLTAKAMGRPIQVVTMGSLSTDCGQHNMVWVLTML